MAIQIHLMFLFIGKSFIRRLLWKFIQIHLMFLFIKLKEMDITAKDSFKYISCSCLSIPLLSHPPSVSYSNTSHVPVYQIPAGRTIGEINAFKYISCSCLSLQRGCNAHSLSIQIHLMFLFIPDQPEELP